MSEKAVKFPSPPRSRARARAVLGCSSTMSRLDGSELGPTGSTVNRDKSSTASSASHTGSVEQEEPAKVAFSDEDSTVTTSSFSGSTPYSAELRPATNNARGGGHYGYYLDACSHSPSEVDTASDLQSANMPVHRATHEPACSEDKSLDITGKPLRQTKVAEKK